VQIYESLSAAIFLALFLIGLARRSQWAMTNGFYWLTIWYGGQRFVWEFVKPYPTLIGPFNLFHILCAGLLIYGIAMVRRSAVVHTPA
jgi:prolipoprotein diacylglyceryltransferase